jgi:superfamily I DNA/RNA helicase
MFKPSKFQKAIFNFIINGIGNAVINAVAGSGKTTTLLQALGLLPKNAKILFLAFNKSIKLEIADKVSKLGLRNVQVDTCHGFGYRAILRSFNKAPKIDQLKYRKLLRSLVNYGTADNSLNEWDC